jgi:hypothetical protein
MGKLLYLLAAKIEDVFRYKAEALYQVEWEFLTYRRTVGSAILPVMRGRDGGA